MCEEALFLTESDLVTAFLRAALGPSAPWPSVGSTREFSFQHGRTDVILIDPEGQVIAFEAKLKDWRTALHQAYRNTSLAHLSFVVVPLRIAKWAVHYAEEFHDRGVGLCSVIDDRVVILLSPEASIPLQSWLSDKAIEAATSMALP